MGLFGLTSLVPGLDTALGAFDKIKEWLPKEKPTTGQGIGLGTLAGGIWGVNKIANAIEGSNKRGAIGRRNGRGLAWKIPLGVGAGLTGVGLGRLGAYGLGLSHLDDDEVPTRSGRPLASSGYFFRKGSKLDKWFGDKQSPERIIRQRVEYLNRIGQDQKIALMDKLNSSLDTRSAMGMAANATPMGRLMNRYLHETIHQAPMKYRNTGERLGNAKRMWRTGVGGTVLDKENVDDQRGPIVSDMWTKGDTEDIGRRALIMGQLRKSFGKLQMRANAAQKIDPTVKIDPSEWVVYQKEGADNTKFKIANLSDPLVRNKKWKNTNENYWDHIKNPRGTERSPIRNLYPDDKFDIMDPESGIKGLPQGTVKLPKFMEYFKEGLDKKKATLPFFHPSWMDIPQIRRESNWINDEVFGGTEKLRGKYGDFRADAEGQVQPKQKEVADYAKKYAKWDPRRLIWGDYKEPDVGHWSDPGVLEKMAGKSIYTDPTWNTPGGIFQTVSPEEYSNGNDNKSSIVNSILGGSNQSQGTQSTANAHGGQVPRYGFGGAALGLGIPGATLLAAGIPMLAGSRRSKKARTAGAVLTGAGGALGLGGLANAAAWYKGKDEYAPMHGSPATHVETPAEMNARIKEQQLRDALNQPNPGEKTPIEVTEAYRGKPRKQFYGPLPLGYTEENLQEGPLELSEEQENEGRSAPGIEGRFRYKGDAPVGRPDSKGKVHRYNQEKYEKVPGGYEDAFNPDTLKRLGYLNEEGEAIKEYIPAFRKYSSTVRENKYTGNKKKEFYEAAGKRYLNERKEYLAQLASQQEPIVPPSPLVPPQQVAPPQIDLQPGYSNKIGVNTFSGTPDPTKIDGLEFGGMVPRYADGGIARMEWERFHQKPNLGPGWDRVVGGMPNPSGAITKMSYDDATEYARQLVDGGVVPRYDEGGMATSVSRNQMSRRNTTYTPNSPSMGNPGANFYQGQRGDEHGNYKNYYTGDAYAPESPTWRALKKTALPIAGSLAGLGINMINPYIMPTYGALKGLASGNPINMALNYPFFKQGYDKWSAGDLNWDTIKQRFSPSAIKENAMNEWNSWKIPGILKNPTGDTFKDLQNMYRTGMLAYNALY